MVLGIVLSGVWIVLAASGAAAQSNDLDTGLRQALMAEWRKNISRHLAQHFARSRPRLQQLFKVVGTHNLVGRPVIVGLVVRRNGTVTEVSIERGSSYPAVDAAVLQWVRQAGSFPSAPARLSVETMPFRLPVNFNPALPHATRM
jgi:TonB family protein